MNIVIPMAGLGSRFRKNGFKLPKPLIKVIDKPMYRHAVDCLPLQLAKNIVFILLESEYSTQIEEDIIHHYNYLPKFSILILDKETEGQAETVLAGKEYLDLYQPTLIHNCDTFIHENFDWETILKQDIDGAIVVFHSDEERWSYIKLDKHNQFVIDIQEKNMISTYASTGTYYFKDTKNLLEVIQKNIAENKRQNNEFYLSTVYQTMLQSEKKIIPLSVKKMYCFGTPQDLVESLNTMFLELRSKK